MRPYTNEEIVKVKRAYLLPIPTVPEIGDPAEADSIWTQAFSRVQYPEAQLASILDTFRRQAKFDDEQTFWLLSQDGFNEGQANQRLADIGLDMAMRYGKNGNPLHKMDQWEVAYSIYAHHHDWYQEFKQFLHPMWPPFTGPLPHVKAGCILESLRLGLKNPIELAAPVIIARAIAHIWALGWCCIVPPFEMSIGQTFVPESCQYQTRRFFDPNPWNCWLVRETYGRWFHATCLLPALSAISGQGWKKIVSLSPPQPCLAL